MKPLAQRVREHRESLGMNPSEYARHVGTSRQNINNVEAGDAEQPRYIGLLAKAMGVTVDELMRGRRAPTAADLEAMTSALEAVRSPDWERRQAEFQAESERFEMHRHGLAPLASSVAILGNVERAIALAALSEWVKQGCPADQIKKLNHLLQGASNDRPARPGELLPLGEAMRGDRGPQEPVEDPPPPTAQPSQAPAQGRGKRTASGRKPQL